MLYKRHLLTFGWDNPALGNEFQKPESKISGMGEDEYSEALPKGSYAPRTWWRKWLKLK